MNHSAIAAPRRQRHDVSISGREGRFSPQTQGLTPHAIPPDGRSKQDDPNLPPASASRWLLEPGDESDTVSADGNDGGDRSSAPDATPQQTPRSCNHRRSQSRGRPTVSTPERPPRRSNATAIPGRPRRGGGCRPSLPVQDGRKEKCRVVGSRLHFACP